MAKICGIENVAFVGKDGTEVRGKRIHFTEALVPLEGKISGMGPFIFLQGLIVIQVLLLSPGRHGLVEGRHGNIDMSLVNQFGHEPVKQS